ncbi:MAG TPA: sulfotransferase [Myxococcota bacterium]|nr:sulfotransferase [Myxococcota bacterium]
MSRTTFDESELVAEACAEAGLADLGAGHRDGLRVLLRTYDENPFHERGRARNRRQVVRWLVTRLRVIEAWRRHPEIRARAIRGPWFLTGLPRSGTSALFNLLAADPSARALLNWEARIPEPLEGLAPGAPDPRRAALAASYERGRAEHREFAAMHYTSVDTPEECVLLQGSSFSCVQTGIEVLLEPYGSWYRAQPLGGMYAYYADLLRLLDWQRPGERWLLKAPAHLWGIRELFAAFPDARVVWSHRDPVASIASVCSMTHLLMRAWMDVDARALGPRVLDFYATSLERGLAAREACDPARFVDVHHDEIARDPIAVVMRVYARFGRPLEGAVRDAIERYARAHPRGEHGEHAYRLADYGLAPEAVHRRFADYCERFAISEGRAR